MTEEDTIRVLRQTPFEELKKLVVQMNTYPSNSSMAFSTQFWEEFFEPHGWTRGEYEFKLRNQSRHN